MFLYKKGIDNKKSYKNQSASVATQKVYYKLIQSDDTNTETFESNFLVLFNLLECNR